MSTPTETAADIVVEGRWLSLRFDGRTGALAEIVRTQDGHTIMRDEHPPGLELSVGGAPGENRLPEPPEHGGVQRETLFVETPGIWPPNGGGARPVGADARLLSVTETDVGRGLEVTVLQQSAGWRYGLVVTLDHTLPLVELAVVAEREHEPAETLNYVRWRSRGWRFAAEQPLTICSPERNNRMRALAAGGAALFWRVSEGETWSWGPLARDVRGFGWDGDAPTDTVDLVLLMGGRCTPRRRLTGGGFVLGISERADARAGDLYRQHYARRGISALPSPPHWSKGAHLYETFVGSWPMDGSGDGYAPYPTTEHLVADLPRLRQLGYDVIYLMPRHPYPSYTAASLTDAAVQYGDGPGTGKRFRALVDAIHAQGMRVIVDVILHGVLDREALRRQEERRATAWGHGPFADHWDVYELAHREAWEREAPATHPYGQEHPEWFVTHPDGTAQFTYTRTFDQRHPGFRAFFVEAMLGLLEDPGIHGLRLDAPNWGLASYRWTEDAGYRASWATGGSSELLSLLAERVRAERPDALLFVEASDVITTRWADMQYPYDEWPILTELLAGELSVHAARERLAYLRRARVPGIAVVHWIDAHDSVWWPAEGSKWVRDRASLAQARCGLATCCLLDGAVMTFSGGETGLEAATQRLFELRRSVPELRYGACDELAIECDHPAVLPLLRSFDGRHLVGVVNWSDASATAHLKLPERARRDGAWSDLLGEASCEGTPEGLRVTLPAWGVGALVRAEGEVSGR